MMCPEPFRYSSEPHQRRHGPSGYTNYQEYKPWLRDEFVFRCVYCLEREVWYPSGSDAFSVDHVVPKSKAPALTCQYENLVYACIRCNSLRREVELSDPTNAALADHLAVTNDGIVHALSVRGQDIIDQLHLNSESAIRTRNGVLRILRLKQRLPADHDVDDMFRELFGYPKDLPDLTKKKPPSGNSRGDATDSCFHACRLRGELSATY
jgi:hypothetical protein